MRTGESGSASSMDERDRAGGSESVPVPCLRRKPGRCGDAPSGDGGSSSSAERVRGRGASTPTAAPGSHACGAGCTLAAALFTAMAELGRAAAPCLRTFPPKV
uniref:Uncharacterized protein n=1 Tax=Alexandrium catenella TaxID=2925 RepID=A0A7S1S2L6_ALECA